MAKNKKERRNYADLDIDELFRDANKEFGDGTLQMYDSAAVVECNSLSTGLASIDRITGIGGVPRGRITEIYGPESGGKTTLSLSIVAACHRQGEMAAFIDVEHALDMAWATNIGIKTEKLAISQPDSGEQALELCEMLIRSHKFGTVIIDSVAALVPQAEIDGEIGDMHIGAQARMLSQAMRKLCAEVSKSNTAVIFINQIREKIGVMFGNPETTPGGRALKFYASMRMEVRRRSSIKDDGHAIGNEVRVKIIKNKVAPPFKEATFSIYFGGPRAPLCGVDRHGSLIDVAVDEEIIEQKGSWYVYDGNKIGNGKKGAVIYLRDNASVADEIRTKIKEKISALRQGDKDGI